MQELRKQYQDQEILRVSELGKSINLILTITVAIQGFLINLLTSNQFKNDFINVEIKLTIIILIFSLGFGSFASILRFSEINIKTIVLLRKLGISNKKPISVKKARKQTLKAFAWQVISFSLGIVIFACLLMLTNIY